MTVKTYTYQSPSTSPFQVGREDPNSKKETTESSNKSQDTSFQASKDQDTKAVLNSKSIDLYA